MDLFNNGNIDDAVKEFEKMIKGLDEVNDRFQKNTIQLFSQNKRQ